MTVDPELARMLQAMAENPSPLESMTPQQAREMHRSTIPFLYPPARQPRVAEVADLDAGGVGARVYRPEGKGPRPTVVFLHGGGWVMGDLDTYDHTARRIAREVDVVVVAVEYGLAPEHPFPQGIEDCLTATRWVLEHAEELGGTAVVAVAGDSAGGSFSAVVAQELRQELAAQLLIYPATDLGGGDYPSRTENGSGFGLDTSTSVWYVQHYFGGRRVDLSDPRLSPRHGNLAGLPRALVVTAQYDPLRDEGEEYARAMQEAGVQVELVREEGMIHGYFEMGALSRVADARVSQTLARFRALLPR